MQQLAYNFARTVFARQSQTNLLLFQTTRTLSAMSAIAEHSEVPPQVNSNLSPPPTVMRTTGLKPPLYPAETKGVHTVCVTGATGYLGSNLVNRLLAAGHTVHGTVRSIAKAEELKKLPNATTNLRLFETDLFNKEGLKNAMKDCVVVFHTASPFSTKVGYGKKAQIALVDPAVKGTENVLGAVTDTPTVKRVVMTSSTSSIVHSYSDRPTGQQATEADWNTRSTLNDCPYNYSKTMAERKAHEIADKQSHWDLVCINPSVIFGPPVINRLDGESIAMVQEVIRGDFSKSCPVWGQGNVDVRDVAAAHCLAAFIPEASGRYIVSAASRLRSELVEIVSNLYPAQVEKPKHVQSKFMASIMAAFKGGRDTVRANYGGVAYFSNEKSVRELGMTYISLEESIKDMCHKLEEMGAINPKK